MQSSIVTKNVFQLEIFQVTHMKTICLPANSQKEAPFQFFLICIFWDPHPVYSRLHQLDHWQCQS